MRNKLFGLSLILFQLFIILILVAVLLTPNQNCAEIVSYYDVKNMPIEVNILKYEYQYVANGDLKVICRYKKIAIDSMSMGYYYDVKD